jgi:glutamine amidotransferase
MRSPVMQNLSGPPLQNHSDVDSSVLDALEPGTAVYFVHSFTASPTDARDRLADSDYNGCRIAAAVQRGNITGLQFHPEKSGPAGLAVLDRFLRQ